MISNKQIKKLKTKLSLIFVSIVFFIVLFSGVSFILYREINSEISIKNELLYQYNGIRDLSGVLNLAALEEGKDRTFINLIVKNSSTKVEIFNKIDDGIPYTIISGIEKLFTNKETDFVSKEVDGEMYKMLKKTFYNDEMKSNLDFYLIKKIGKTTSLNIIIFSFFVFNLILSFIFYMIGYFLSNQNLKPVEENILALENFIRDAGHELKTPIASVYSSLTLAEKIGNYEESVKECIPIISDMDKIIDGLLKLANISTVKLFQKIDLSKEILNMIKIYQNKIKDKKFELEVKIKENVFLIANEEYIGILISNLISNAIKYNKENGKIIIGNTEKSFYVEDSGIGIRKESQEKIFDRFYREDESRANNGFGIGLSLVKKIITIYDWNIVLNSEPMKGTRIEIFFKK